MPMRTAHSLMFALTIIATSMIAGCSKAEDTNPAQGTYSEDKWLSPEKRIHCVESAIAGDKAALELLLTHYFTCGKDERQLRFWVEFGVQQNDEYAKTLQKWLKEQNLQR